RSGDGHPPRSLIGPLEIPIWVRPGDMTDALSLIPASVLRNLADKLYEKRKNAALEVFWPMPFFRYYACEALYNIAKDIVTDSDQFRCTI
ncbi:hypothetical protein BHM03_00040795, partial [Ensete ventricosum]